MPVCRAGASWTLPTSSLNNTSIQRRRTSSLSHGTCLWLDVSTQLGGEWRPSCLLFLLLCSLSCCIIYVHSAEERRSTLKRLQTADVKTDSCRQSSLWQTDVWDFSSLFLCVFIICTLMTLVPHGHMTSRLLLEAKRRTRVLEGTLSRLI